MDAIEWQSILVSNSFGATNSDLRKTFANVVKMLCTDITETQTIEAFFSFRLISIDENPGLRPIGVGEVLRRIAGKVIGSAFWHWFFTSMCESKSWNRATAHLLNSLHNDENNEAMLLVDAINVFNLLHQQVFCYNISYIFPAISVFVQNYYNSLSTLFIIGGKEFKSSKSTAHGNSVSMATYDTGVIPLTNMVIEIVITSAEIQIRVLAYVEDLRKWLDNLNVIGPKSVNTRNQQNYYL